MMQPFLGDAHWQAFLTHITEHCKPSFLAAFEPPSAVLRCVGKCDSAACPHGFEVDFAAPLAIEQLEHLHVDHEQDVLITCDMWRSALPRSLEADPTLGKPASSSVTSSLGSRRTRSTALRCSASGAARPAVAARPATATSSPCRTTVACATSACEVLAASLPPCRPSSPFPIVHNSRSGALDPYRGAGVGFLLVFKCCVVCS